MTELERLLLEAARELEWPQTPRLEVPAGARPKRHRGLVLVLAAAALVALAVALAVPGARSAILRVLHLQGVTIQRVSVLPPAEERPLSDALGPSVTAAEAGRMLGQPVALPPLSGHPTLHLHGQVVSVLLQERKQPVLLSEFRSEIGEYILKKIVGGSTGVEGMDVGGSPGIWISGAEHLYIAPQAPPRLAGNVLLWVTDGIVYRLEGPGLSQVDALRLAVQIHGT